MYRLELQSTEPTMFFKKDGEFTTDKSKAEIFSSDKAEEKNIELQLKGIKTWIVPTN